MRRLFDEMEDMMEKRRSLFSLRDTEEDDDFFSDVPTFFSRRRDREVDEEKNEEEKNKEETGPQRKWYSYSSSSTSYVDENGERYSTSKRMFEDSSGRRKMKKERRINDQSVMELEDTKGDGVQTRELKNVVDRESFEKEWEERFSNQRSNLQLKNRL